MHTVEYAVATCPSIRLSVTRRYYVEMAEHINIPFHLRVATSFWFFRTKLYGNILTEISLTGTSNAGDFRPIYCCISETMQDRAIVNLRWNTNSKSYAIYRMVIFPITLNDPYLRLHGHAITWRWIFLYFCCHSRTVKVVVDIDDCVSFPCGFDNDCIDKVNGYTCSCGAGYVADSTWTRCIGLNTNYIYIFLSLGCITVLCS